MNRPHRSRSHAGEHTTAGPPAGWRARLAALLRGFRPRPATPTGHGILGPGAVGAVPRQRDGDDLLGGVYEFEQRCAPLVRPVLAELAARGQRPRQLFITCADSRVVPNLITATGPGDLFCVRTVGNLVPRHVAAFAEGDHSVGAAVEYAVEVLGVTTIAVCGHSDCGAVRALLTGSAPPRSHLRAWLRHAEPSLIRFHEPASPSTEELPVAERLCVTNVAQQVENLLTYPSVREAVQAGRLNLVGMYFDLAATRVYLVDPDRYGLDPVRAPAAG
ncbi:carbonic anhydrase [Solihabitans fulvus]|nr:carbonic anhydrase [Solihabitans fulvus]